MTYDNTVAKMTRSNFNPKGGQLSSSTGFQQEPKHQTQYQMMNSYQSNGSLKKGLGSTMNEFTNQKFIYATESPHYSAHHTNAKFFKTIDESPILSAGEKPPLAPSTNPRPSRNKMRNEFQSADPAASQRQSVAELRAQHAQKLREKSPFDSNIEHGISFMERVVRHKNYQINQRSLALTGRLAIDDQAAVQHATNTTKNSPHKMIIIPVRTPADNSPSKEFKKTQCNITRFVKGLKDTRVQTMNNMCILRPNIR